MFSWIDDELSGRKEQSLYRSRRQIQFASGARIRWQNREFINFSSNDYLNLATDPRLAEAASASAHEEGCGAGSSPLISGYSQSLQNLEEALAQWEGTESALVFSSGFATNLAVVSTLADASSALFSDQLNHASLIDGCRLSRADVHVYRHGDFEQLRQLLKQSKTNRRFIVSDSVFSMDGDVVQLDILLEIAEEFDCIVLLDEAHATGVIGERGCGVTELHPTSERVIKIGTLSKALGAQGGFVCASRRVIDYLVNRGRPYIFSTALAPPIAAAALRAIQIVQEEPERREHLSRLASLLRNRLIEQGWDIGASQSHIIPVIVGESSRSLDLSSHLEKAGLLVPAIRPPSVPSDSSRLRISLTAGHTIDDIEQLLLFATREKSCEKRTGSTTTSSPSTTS